MKDKSSVIYSIWSIIRLIIISLVFMGIINFIPLIITGKINSYLMNYSIALSILIGVVIDIKWIEKKSLSKVGLCFHVKDIAFFGGGILLAFLLCGICVAVVSIFRGINIFPMAIKAILGSNRGLSAYIVIPFAEEIFHRGYFMGNCFQRLPYWKRSVLSAFLFSLSHWMGSGYSSIFMFIFAMAISTFLFGFLFNNLRMITNSIWMGFSLHWFFNFIFSCIFLDTENYNIAVIVVFLVLVVGSLITSLKVQKQQISD